VADTDVHSDHARLAVAGWDMPLHLDGEGDEPAVSLAADGGGDDSGSTLLKATGQLPCGLVGLEDADSRKLDMPAVGEHLDLAGGEPTGVPAMAFSLGSGEAHAAASAPAASVVGPVLEGAGQPIQAGGVRLLAVLGPPGGNLRFGLIPLPPQLGQGPRHFDVLTGPTLLQALLDQPQSPVVGIAGGATVGGKDAPLSWGGVEGEPVGLDHRGHGAAS
jgi:hypothetical protein